MHFPGHLILKHTFVFLIRLMDINVSLPWIDTSNSFSFRPWIDLIWEISTRNRRQISSFFGARLFCQITKMLGIIDIWYIHVFRDTVSEKCSCPNMGRARPHGPGPWARAHIGPWPGAHMGLAHIDMISSPLISVNLTEINGCESALIVRRCPLNPINFFRLRWPGKSI